LAPLWMTILPNPEKNPHATGTTAELDRNRQWDGCCRRPACEGIQFEQSVHGADRRGEWTGAVRQQEDATGTEV